MDITFEPGRLYVAPRKSVLFVAKVGDERVRCYVELSALIDPPRALREDTDVFQRCLLAYDEYRGLIQAAARRLIESNAVEPDGEVIVSRAALNLTPKTPLGALDAARRRSASRPVGAPRRPLTRKRFAS